MMQVRKDVEILKMRRAGYPSKNCFWRPKETVSCECTLSISTEIAGDGTVRPGTMSPTYSALIPVSRERLGERLARNINRQSITCCSKKLANFKLQMTARRVLQSFKMSSSSHPKSSSNQSIRYQNTRTSNKQPPVWVTRLFTMLTTLHGREDSSTRTVTPLTQ